MSAPKYPHIKVKLVGKDGNAFAILGAVTGAMRKHHVSEDDINAYTKQAMSGDYNHLLATTCNWVDVV